MHTDETDGQTREPANPGLVSDPGAVHNQDHRGPVMSAPPGSMDIGGTAAALDLAGPRSAAAHAKRRIPPDQAPARARYPAELAGSGIDHGTAVCGPRRAEGVARGSGVRVPPAVAHPRHPARTGHLTAVSRAH
ncbi:hypothetical protein Acsp05_16640 [Actinokineospora sp. NBRC 105648]|nr:hypothetical protein Acsp05_16640 [Actinokineospora sp. NBRC 105648]